MLWSSIYIHLVKHTSTRLPFYGVLCTSASLLHLLPFHSALIWSGGVWQPPLKNKHTQLASCVLFFIQQSNELVCQSFPSLFLTMPFFFFLLAIISQLIPFSLNSVLDFIPYISSLFGSVSFYWIIIINGFEDSRGPLSGSDIQTGMEGNQVPNVGGSLPYFDIK